MIHADPEYDMGITGASRSRTSARRWDSICNITPADRRIAR